jgi:hypothetical protein
MGNVILGSSPLNESIYFDYAPSATYAGHINKYPFRVFITSVNDKPHVVTLDSEYSKSYKPQKNKNKWSFLRPEVRFLDLDLNEIDHVVTKDTKLYLTNNGYITSTPTNNFIGVSGYADFYFVDDIYNYDLVIKNEKYSTIVAILQTSGIDYFDNKFSYNGTPPTSTASRSPHIQKTDNTNSLAIAKQPHVFLYRDPDYIKISENGIRDFINPRWTPTDQHTIFTFNWYENFNGDIEDGNGLMVYKNNFNKSLPSNTNKQDIEISCQGDTMKVYFNDEIKFCYLDENKYKIPGYCKTYFNVSTAVDLVTLSAISTFESPSTEGMFYNSKIWLSNPMAGQLALLEYNAPHYIFKESFNINLNNQQNSFELNILSSFIKANIYTFDMPLVKDNFRNFGGHLLAEDPFAASNYHSIDCIAVLPSPSNQAWAIDSDLNKLYKINTNGSILSSIDLIKLIQSNSNSLPEPFIKDVISPTSVTLDKDLNIFITCYDYKYVLGLDKNANFQYVLDLQAYVENFVYPDINKDWYKSNQPHPDDDPNIQNYIEPTYLDIDSENYIWVTYSNYLSGFLLKFDRYNRNYVTINYPICSCPQDIIIDNKDNVWVALSNNIWNSIGSIQKLDSNGNTLSSFNSIMGVNNLALDLNQNLWFTYSYSRIGRIDNLTGQIYTFSIFDTINSTDQNIDDIITNVKLNSNINNFEGENPSFGLTDINKNTDETLFEGIICDMRGFMYVINSIANQVLVYETKNNQIKFIDKFYVNPQGLNFWTQFERGQTLSTNNIWGKSLQAKGDCTGLRWVNKYAKFNSNTYTKTITGKSVPLKFKNIPTYVLEDRYGFLATTFYKYIHTNFNEKIKVYPRRTVLKNAIYFYLDFFKINESFDLSYYMKSFAFMPNLYNSIYLFDTFLSNIYGTYPYQHFDLGIYTYEKIANFNLNHSDVDVCNVKNLYNLSQMLDQNTDDYILDYPNETKRLMDFLSINPCRIFGSVNKNQNYFIFPNDKNELNLGSLLTINYMVTAGVNVILKEKSTNKFELIETGLIDRKNIYSLKTLSDFLRIGSIQYPWEKYYEYYEFKETKNTKYSDNLIDWDNPQTTFINNLTSINDWFGDEEYIDSIFSYNLYRGLNIF